MQRGVIEGGQFISPGVTIPGKRQNVDPKITPYDDTPTL